MTVEELIEQLKNLPKDLKVVIEINENGFGYTTEDFRVEEIDGVFKGDDFVTLKHKLFIRDAVLKCNK